MIKPGKFILQTRLLITLKIVYILIGNNIDMKKKINFKSVKINC